MMARTVHRGLAVGPMPPAPALGAPGIGVGGSRRDLKARVADVTQALARVPRQAPAQEVTDTGGRLGGKQAEVRLPREDAREDVRDGLAREERFPGQHLEEHDPEGHGKTLIATSRLRRGSKARYTSPMPPAPRGPRTS